MLYYIKDEGKEARFSPPINVGLMSEDKMQKLSLNKNNRNLAKLIRWAKETRQAFIEQLREDLEDERLYCPSYSQQGGVITRYLEADYLDNAYMPSGAPIQNEELISFLYDEAGRIDTDDVVGHDDYYVDFNGKVVDNRATDNYYEDYHDDDDYEHQTLELDELI